MRNTYYQSLDGLRAIAVLIVLVSHAKITSHIRSGGVGVDIFFVLSGFLITTIISTEIKRYGNLNFRNFYAKRFLRLTPCLVLVAGFYAAWSLTQNRVPLQTLVICLTYTANYARALYDIDLGGLEHAWSLAIEEQFYLVWPAAILLLERSVSRTPVKAIILFGVALVLAAYRFALVGSVSAERIYFALDTHADGLVMGAGLSYLVSYLRQTGGLPAVLSKLLSWVAVPVGVLGLLVLMKFSSWTDRSMGYVGYFLAASAGAILILDLVVGRHSFLQKALGWGPLVWIGKISYGLYLWHYVLYYMISEQFVNVPMGYQAIPKLILSFIAAVVSYNYFEMPFLRLKRRFEREVPVKQFVDKSEML